MNGLESQIEREVWFQELKEREEVEKLGSKPKNICLSSSVHISMITVTSISKETNRGLMVRSESLTDLVGNDSINYFFDCNNPSLKRRYGPFIQGAARGMYRSVSIPELLFLITTSQDSKDEATA
jgi:hypothetical protein